MEGDDTTPVVSGSCDPGGMTSKAAIELVGRASPPSRSEIVGGARRFAHAPATKPLLPHSYRQRRFSFERVDDLDAVACARRRLRVSSSCSAAMCHRPA